MAQVPRQERVMCLVHEDRGAMATSAECRECYDNRVRNQQLADSHVAALEQALREVAWQALYRPQAVRQTALTALKEVNSA